MHLTRLPFVPLLAVASAIFLSPLDVQAVYPETGMYVETSQEARGKGYYIELQGDTVFLVIYAYDEETGEAEIYTAASEIRDDAVSMGFLLPDDPPFSTDGYFPLHWMTGRLFRVTDGPCLDCGGPPDGFVTEGWGCRCLVSVHGVDSDCVYLGRSIRDSGDVCGQAEFRTRGNLEHQQAAPVS
ncbi:hypothetical protein [Halomonas denitrificans]|nr:hypothetical protein [Halomonas denitrificans]